jgi:aspartyl protease family protein
MSLAGKHYLAGLIWCVLLGIAYTIIDGQIKPKVATATGSSIQVEIPRSRDGHFYVAGTINGQALTFMVDTGASTVAISQSVAQRLGLSTGRPVSIGTAGGMTQGVEFAGVSLKIGGITLNNVRIVVLAEMPGEALLGQNVLRHLEVLQTTDRMLLRAKSPASS